MTDRFPPMRVPPKPIGPRPQDCYRVYARTLARPFFTYTVQEYTDDEEVRAWLEETLCPVEPQLRPDGRIATQIVRHDTERWMIANHHPIQP